MKLTLPEHQASFVLSSALSTAYNTEQLKAFWWLLEAFFCSSSVLQDLCACMLSHFSYVQFFVTPWTVAHRLLCPWNSPGKNTVVGCHALLQGIFLTQGWNPCMLYLLHDMWVLYHRAIYVCLVAKSCPTLCDPVDCSPPGSSAHGIFRNKKK